ncbi:zinc finger BED domain-containing protein RICESLEEPER 2-like [Senna tora]|uniref:Zinc finger BED domain-containing protein RICESLEEPER 2-like n=1 Tax=Senna tora TaxID=362788 RepID=A0A834WBD6_9FABA|nr:zinc finger BED domain-containing protein RICESLEEPER 2-like [Senna tora]
MINLCKEFPRDLKNDPKQKVLAFQPKRKEQGETLAIVCFDHELSTEALARMVIIDELPFRVINFCQISDHKGDTIRKAIEKKLLECKIEKVFSIKVDNAASNDVAISYLKKRIIARKGSVVRCELLRMRCCAHILNLIVMDGLKDVNDSILKIRNAVRYVRSSPSRLQKFKTCAEAEKIECKSLVSLYVCTRWNSTYLMLESSLKFKSTFERLEDTSGDFLLEFGGESDRRKGPPTLVEICMY